MPNDLIERVARAIDAAAQSRTYRDGDMARAAIREVLAEIREPSEAMQEAAMHRIGWLAIRGEIAVFIRENGLEAPVAAQEGQPDACGVGGRGILKAPGQTPADGLLRPLSARSACGEKSNESSSTVLSEPLPAHRTPSGHAA